MLHTAHTTRLCKCCKTSTAQRRKRSHTYLNLEVNNNHLRQQQSWCNLSQLSSRLTFISTVIVLIVWDDNENIIVAYRTASSVVTSLAVITTLIEMFWHTTTFQKECHIMFLTVDTISRNQHTLTLNQNHIDVQWLMGSHLFQCNTESYKQDIHIRQHENDPCLTRVSVESKLLLINEKNWISISICKSESDDISIIQNEGPTSCQLRNTYLYDTYMMVIVVVIVVIVVAELVVQESVLKYSIKKGFTYKSCWWRSWKRKKKKSCTWGKGL